MPFAQEVIGAGLGSLLERITFDPAQCGGRPCIRHYRLRVQDVLDLLGAGVTGEQILKNYEFLEHEDIRACLQYAAEQVDHAVLKVAQVRFIVGAQLPPRFDGTVAAAGARGRSRWSWGWRKVRTVRSVKGLGVSRPSL